MSFATSIGSTPRYSDRLRSTEQGTYPHRRRHSHSRTAEHLLLPPDSHLSTPKVTTDSRGASYLYLMATKTSTVTMGLGNALTEFSNAGATRPYWVGFQYTSADGSTTNQLCVPLTKDLSLPATWQWPGIAEAGPTGGIHGMTDVFIVKLINSEQISKKLPNPYISIQFFKKVWVWWVM